jgi:hypothetical protein
MVWMSSVYSNYLLGNKSGVRNKYFGLPWTPAEFKLGLLPSNIHEAMNRNANGFPAAREDMPEAAAVWEPKRFKQQKDIFALAGYFVITGELVELFSTMDLGNGGLVPLPFFEADLVTPLDQKFYLLNVGARKAALLPEQCEDLQKFILDRETGQQLWEVNRLQPEAVIKLSRRALEGPDLWADENVYGNIFLSERLGSALLKTRQGKDWKLCRCQVEGAAKRFAPQDSPPFIKSDFVSFAWSFAVLD